MKTLLGLHLNPNSNLYSSLLKIFGVGPHRAVEICRAIGIQPSTRINMIRKEYEDRIKDVIDEKGFIVQARLKKFNNERMKLIVSEGSYYGERIKAGLPVRGQRTHTNAKSAKRLNRQRVVG